MLVFSPFFDRRNYFGFFRWHRHPEQREESRDDEILRVAQDDSP